MVRTPAVSVVGVGAEAFLPHEPGRHGRDHGIRRADGSESIYPDRERAGHEPADADCGIAPGHGISALTA